MLVLKLIHVGERGQRCFSGVYTSIIHYRQITRSHDGKSYLVDMKKYIGVSLLTDMTDVPRQAKNGIKKQLNTFKAIAND